MEVTSSIGPCGHYVTSQWSIFVKVNDIRQCENTKRMVSMMNDRKRLQEKIEEMLQMLTNKDQFLKRRGFESRQRKRQKKWQCQKGNPKFVGTRTLNPLHHKWWSVHYWTDGTCGTGTRTLNPLHRKWWSDDHWTDGTLKNLAWNHQKILFTLPSLLKLTTSFELI